jgi:hypothetical protein
VDKTFETISEGFWNKIIFKAFPNLEILELVDVENNKFYYSVIDKTNTVKSARTNWFAEFDSMLSDTDLYDCILIPAKLILEKLYERDSICVV